MREFSSRPETKETTGNKDSSFAEQRERQRIADAETMETIDLYKKYNAINIYVYTHIYSDIIS